MRVLILNILGASTIGVDREVDVSDSWKIYGSVSRQICLGVELELLSNITLCKS
jgi:hypothetical protein